MLRKANPSDIPTMMKLRLEVTENRLSDPSTITTEMVLQSITVKGCGWVYEARGSILGFSIAVEQDPSIWALFVRTGFEGRGVGHALHEAAVSWLWQQGASSIWLTTAPATRAESFYRAHGWQEIEQREGDLYFVLARPVISPMAPTVN